MANLLINPFFNLGDWSQAQTFEEATRALVFRLADYAEVDDGQRILDVGVGSGEQVRLLAQRYASNIEGIDPHLPKSAGLAWPEEIRARTRLNTGVGECLEASFSSCDRVLALDSAYHFRTREDFFREAHRVLKPGGVLAAFDLAFKALPTRVLGGLAALAGVPKENRWVTEGVKGALVNAKFESVEVSVIDDDVWPGLLAFAKSHPKAIGSTTLQRMKFSMTMSALRRYKNANAFALNALLYKARKPMRLA